MNVRVCNFKQRTFNEQFLDSLINTGFAVVTNHGVDHELIKDTQDAWRKFFKENRSYKEEFVNHQDSNMGYKGLFGERAVGASKADIKEFFHWKPGQLLPTGAAGQTHKMFFTLENRVSSQLLNILNQAFPSFDHVKACDGSDNTVFRALYYPALNEVDRERGQIRAAEHSDINFITLLVAATSSGLEVQDRAGDWHEVPFQENSIVVNIGDMLQLSSRGLFKSTPHRVINPSNMVEDRVSLPLFVHPHSETILAPGVTAQQFLTERLNTIYQKGGK